MKIFLLEDEYALRISIEEFLEELGYEVRSFENGEKCFDAFFEEGCDLMLLDVKVPGINGFELLQQVRGYGREVPAIFITSMTHVDDLARGFELGCCDYIKKPFDLKELQVRMENVLKRECFQSKDHIIELGPGCYYDIKNFVLTKDEEEIALTKQEKKILELLIKRRSEVVSTQEICDEVWGEYVDSANVRVHINKLRKKLGKEVIKTVHGIGYRLDR